MVRSYNIIVAAVIAFAMTFLPVSAQTPENHAVSGELDALYDQLTAAGPGEWQLLEQEIQRLWGLSGSASADFLLLRGREALESGEIEAAIDHLTALTDHAPDFPTGWNARATAYFSAGQFGPALDDLRHTLVLDPRNYEALAGIGVLFEQMGEFEAAHAAFEAARAIHPNQPNLQDAVNRLSGSVGGSTL